MDSPFVLLADRPDHPAIKSYLLYNDEGAAFVQTIQVALQKF
jgi:hypothetical protein